jgi:hypothetical protein
MKTQWFNSIELWFTLGLLALNLSFVIERYALAGEVSKFFQGLFIGLSIAANIMAIILLPARVKPHKQ